MSIIKFIKDNLEFINEKIANKGSNSELKFKLIYKKPNELLTFIFQGSGTYGNVFKVINNTENNSEIPINKSVILKIMKKKNEELNRLKLIAESISKIKNKYLINKYIMRVNNIDLYNDLVFLECIDGFTLSDYVKKNILSKSEFNILLLKAILCIKTLHNVLNFSHRDIKGPNIVYDPNKKIMKCIDYGFIVKLDDDSYKNKYNGTASYIHPDMNKKRLKMKNNNSLEYPNYISQDLFATIIMLLKLYNSVLKVNSKNNNTKNNRNYNNTKNNTKKNINNKDNIFRNIINDYSNSIGKEKKSSSRNIKEKIRYNSKKKLLDKLLHIDENIIENLVIREIIKLLKEHWNESKIDFCMNNTNNLFITNFIFDSLVFNIFKVLEPSDEKKALYYDWCLIYYYKLKK